MPGERDGLDDAVADGLPGDQRSEEHRELSFAGAGQQLGGRVEHEVGERLTERSFGAVDD